MWKTVVRQVAKSRWKTDVRHDSIARRGTRITAETLTCSVAAVHLAVYEDPGTLSVAQRCKWHVFVFVMLLSYVIADI